MGTYEASDTAIYHNTVGTVKPAVSHRSKTSSRLMGKEEGCADAGVSRYWSIAIVRLKWEVAD